MAKLSSTQILAMYNATHKTKVSADASLYQLEQYYNKSKLQENFDQLRIYHVHYQKLSNTTCTNREGSIGRDLGS